MKTYQNTFNFMAELNATMVPKWLSSFPKTKHLLVSTIFFVKIAHRFDMMVTYVTAADLAKTIILLDLCFAFLGYRMHDLFSLLMDS